MEKGEERARCFDARFEWLAAFGLYLALSSVFFGRALAGHFFDYYIGRDTDPSLYMWYLAWWPHAIRSHLNPLFTHVIWTPVGFDLAWAPCFPLLAIAASPLTIALGPVATYNIATLVMPPLAAVCTFWLCRRLTGRFVPALFAGFVFGFSPYVMGQLLSHMNQVLIFPFPILACLAMKRLYESFTTRRFVGLFALTLAAEFFLSLEQFALTALVGAIAIAAALLSTSGEARSRVRALIVPISASYALVAAVVAPYLYCYFEPGYPKHPLWSPTEYAADFMNLVLPTSANLLGANQFARLVSSRFTGTLYDQGACLGLPLILIVVAWGRRHWKEPLARTLVVTLIAVCALATGPVLHVAGAMVLPMPWLIFQRLPLISGAMPVRLMAFAFLIAAVIAALWLADPAVSRRTKLIGAAAALIMMLPNPSASYWASPIRTPAFFRDGSSRRMLSLNDIVLPLPFGARGMCMLWQAESGMSFRMASGVTGLSLIEIRRWPVVNAFYGSRDLPEPGTQLKAFIANLGITAVVVDDSDPHAPQFKKLLSLLDIAPTKVSGVSLYRIPVGGFSSYRSLSAVEMETRADRLRFETILRAAAKYLAQGGAAGKLSVPRLQAAGLLPEGWKFNPAPKDYRDVWAGPWKTGLIGVGVIGTPSALKPLISRYLPEADFAYSPYPHQIKGPRLDFVVRLIEPVTSDSVSGESFRFLMMAFKPAVLQAQARRIEAAYASSPSAGAAGISPGASPREASRR